jgi:ABC-2 type transport system permease protein
MILMTALRKEILEQWRTYRLLVVALTLTVFGMLSPLFAKMTPQLLGMLPGGEQFVNLMPSPTMSDAVTQYVKNISQFALLLAIFVTMGAVAQEREKGTAVMILVKPLSRSTFLFAKLLALALTFVIAIALAAVAGYYYTLFLFGAPDLLAWLGMNVLLLVETLVYVAITLLASTVIKSQAAAAATGFVALLLFSVLGALPTIGEYMPGQLSTWALALFQAGSTSSIGALVVCLVAIAASLIAAWLVFDRQEL